VTDRPDQPTPPPGRLRLVVLFGGASAEHDISCVTASSVLQAVDPARYDIVPIGITRDGRWVRNDDAIASLTQGAAALPGQLEVVGTEIEQHQAVTSDDVDVATVVLPLLHGPHGEDGTVQGMLEIADVPYVGSGVLGSALCMDKSMAKTVTGAAGIPQCKAFNLTAGQGDATHLADRAEAIMAIGDITFPVFVKPANLGSSIGITKAHDADELVAALRTALEYDERLVVEETVDGREIEVAVLGNAIGDAPPRASVPGEIVPAAEFYDFADKYDSDAAALLIPAELSDDESDAVRALALEAFAALRCDGMARVDFFYEPEGRGFLLNEINTIPGFTPLSMYPKLWEASGLGYSELIDELVSLAVERHTRRSGFRTDH
jgi:D-alanine-D-alanine ligase